MERRQALRDYLLALAFFSGVTILYLWPVLRQAGSAIGPGLGDPLFNLYLLKWEAHKATTGLAGLWSPPFFYPAQGVLAYSDHLFGLAALFVPLVLAGATPFTAYNALVFIAYAFTGTHVTWVLRQGGRSFPAALLGGLAYTYCSFRWAQAYHIQVLWTLWVPLLLWLFYRLLDQPSLRRAIPFLVVYVLHLLGGCYLAYMAHIALAAMVAAQGRRLSRWIRDPNARRTAVLVAAVCGATATAVFLPYVRIGRSLGLHRLEAEFAGWGTSLASFATPTWFNWYSGPAFASWRRSENELFFGFLPTALALYAALLTTRSWLRSHQGQVAWRRRAGAAGAVALGGAGLALAEWTTWAPYLNPSAPHHLPSRQLVFGCLVASAIAGAWSLRRPAAARDPVAPGPSWERSLLVASATCLAFSYPPIFIAAARALPGLNGMRVPARFFAFASLGLALLAARGLDAVAARLAARQSRALVAAIVILVLVEDWPRKLDWSPIPDGSDVSAADLWVGRTPEVQALADLPFALEGREFEEISALYRESSHWKPVVNGYSGYLAPSFVALRDTVTRFPDPEQVAELRTLGVTHVIFRGSFYQSTRRLRRKWDAWLESLRKLEPPPLEEAFSDPDSGDVVFRIVPAALPAAPDP